MVNQTQIQMPKDSSSHLLTASSALLHVKVGKKTKRKKSYMKVVLVRFFCSVESYYYNKNKNNYY